MNERASRVGSLVDRLRSRLEDPLDQLHRLHRVGKVTGRLTPLLNAVDEMAALVPESEPVVRSQLLSRSQDRAAELSRGGRLRLAVVGDQKTVAIGVDVGRDVLPMELRAEDAPAGHGTVVHRSHRTSRECDRGEERVRDGPGDVALAHVGVDLDNVAATEPAQVVHRVDAVEVSGSIAPS